MQALKYIPCHIIHELNYEEISSNTHGGADDVDFAIVIGLLLDNANCITP